MRLQFKKVYKMIGSALKEDLGRGDITTGTLFSAPVRVTANIVAKQKGVVCGLSVVGMVFKILSRKTTVVKKVADGTSVKPGDVVCVIKGNARKILAGERVALNFLSRLSGIATLTRKYVAKVRPYNVKIMDTRKTTPGLRELEKYAVRIGGGHNHRMGLASHILIKDNHKKILSAKLETPLSQTHIQKIRKRVHKDIDVEIEVETLKEFREVLGVKANIIMLDNMRIPQIKKAVKLRNKHRLLLEASGRVNIDNVRDIAKTGVDMISIGALTHSPKSLDFSLEVT